MTLDGSAAGLVVGMVGVGVVAWAAWLSVGSSRHGPGWALGVLSRWKAMPWMVAVAGVAVAVVVEPRWVGFAVVYIGIVTGWLARGVMGRLQAVHDMYGGFDAPGTAAEVTSRRTGAYLLATAVLLLAAGAVSLSSGGAVGAIAGALALCLAVAGLLIRRRA